MKRIMTALLAVSLLFALCACGSSADDVQLTYPAAFAGLEELIDAAREDGRLTVLTAQEDSVITALCEKFEELFDVPVTCRAVGDELPSGGDVWYGDESVCRTLSESGALLPYTPAAASGLAAAGYDHGDYCAVNVDALGIMVNSDVLNRMGISAPHALDELLEAVYRELIWLPSYDTAEGRLFIRAALAQYGDDTAAYLTKLDTNVQFYTTGTDTAAKCLASGECVIGIGWLSSSLAAQRESSSTVIRMWVPASEGVPAQVQATAILAGATHSNAAKLWQEFALSASAMELAEKSGCSGIPTVRDTQEALPSISPDSIEIYAAEDEETAAAVDQVIAEVMAALTENGVDTEDPLRWSVA